MFAQSQTLLAEAEPQITIGTKNMYGLSCPPRGYPFPVYFDRREYACSKEHVLAVFVEN